jgi:Gpi18-like mannosyltransferase
MDRPVSLQWMSSWLVRNRYYIASMAVQLALFPFGHWFDTRIFFGTAAGVAHGSSPYSEYDLGEFYNSPSLVGVVSGIGYPPPWALFLAAIYFIVYLPTQNPFAMNLAIKVPIIMGNLLLARFVGRTLVKEGCNPSTASQAELLVLFNPYLLYTSAFWNMYDTFVAYLMLVSFYFLYRDKPIAAGLSLGMSIALKHLALPLIPLAWLWLARRPLGRLERVGRLSLFTSSLLSMAIVFVMLPFYLLNWPVSGFLNAVTYQTVVTGGFTVYNTILINLGSPSLLSVLGYLPFITAMGGYVVLRKRELKTFRDLTMFALLILIAFMTTRTFLAEQNLAVIFPLILFPELLSGRGFRVSNRFWMLFLFYAVWNSVPILFTFLIVPDAFDIAVAITTSVPFGPIRQGILFGSAVVLLLYGWNYILRRS